MCEALLVAEEALIQLACVMDESIREVNSSHQALGIEAIQTEASQMRTTEWQEMRRCELQPLARQLLERFCELETSIFALEDVPPAKLDHDIGVMEKENARIGATVLARYAEAAHLADTVGRCASVRGGI